MGSALFTSDEDGRREDECLARVEALTEELHELQLELRMLSLRRRPTPQEVALDAKRAEVIQRGIHGVTQRIAQFQVVLLRLR